MSPHLIILALAGIAVVYLITRNDAAMKSALANLVMRFLPWK